MVRYLISLMVACSILSACCHKTSVAEKGVAEGQSPSPKLVVATVVDFSHLAGCTFVLQVKDGAVLEPESLEERYRHNGRKVLIRYHEVNRMSVCMAGQPVVIDHIEFSEVR